MITTIDKIKTLRQFIKQGGACYGISCNSCRLSLVDDVRIGSCEELHAMVGSKNQPNASTDLNPDFVRVAKKRIIEILQQEVKK